jgi:pyrroline-5-carboxylate reductase
VNQGVSPIDASFFVGRSYLSMVQDAEVDCHTNPRRFDDLIEEQTPGGLNEQVRHSLLYYIRVEKT